MTLKIDLISLQKNVFPLRLLLLLSESRHAVQLELAAADRHHSQQQQCSFTSVLTHGGETKGELNMPVIVHEGLTVLCISPSVQDQ